MPSISPIIHILSSVTFVHSHTSPKIMLFLCSLCTENTNNFILFNLIDTDYVLQIWTYVVGVKIIRIIDEDSKNIWSRVGDQLNNFALWYIFWVVGFDI